MQNMQKAKEEREYGHLPSKSAKYAEPWKRVNVDMVGLWTGQAHSKTIQLLEPIIVNPATGWSKLSSTKYHS
jgi:hypothetical protein